MKKLKLEKQIIVNLNESQQSRIKGGTDTNFYCQGTSIEFCSRPCPTDIWCETKNCATNDPYGTQCCSADLEICNTNSDPYCTAC